MNILAPEDYEFYYDNFWKRLYCAAVTEYYYTEVQDIFEASLKAHSFISQIRSNLPVTGWQTSVQTVRLLYKKMGLADSDYITIRVSNNETPHNTN